MLFRSGKDGIGIDGVKKAIKTSIDAHNKEFDHSKIDPFIVGTKKVSEEGMSKGMFLQYDGEKLQYAEMPSSSESKWKMRGGGTTLPQKTGNAGKFLKVNSDLTLSWATVSGGTDSRIYNQTPSEAADGTITTFTLPDTFTENSTSVFVGGLRMKLGAIYDYTEGSNTIVFNDPPPSGVNIVVDYSIS